VDRFFTFCASRIAMAAGQPLTFAMALGIIAVWAVTGPLFDFSDTWQLIINTGTTIVTFLMVFLIQNSQNRDARAIQLKLDELLRAVEKARTDMVDLENCTDEELDRLQEQFHRLHDRLQRRKERNGHCNDDLNTSVNGGRRAVSRYPRHVTRHVSSPSKL
jgi:low affinity Fe/Cu permease